jgi:hypothetical protein
MKIYVTNLNGQQFGSVGMVAQNNVLKFAQCFGAHEMGIFSYNSTQEPWPEKSARYDGIIAGIHSGDIVIFQYPSWNMVDWDIPFFNRLKTYGARVIVFLHDVVPLQYDSNYYLMEKYMQIYNGADVLIVPSQKMYDKLVEEGLTNKNYVIQGFWDIPCDFDLYNPAFEKKLIFAGNPSRFPYISDWKYNIPIHVYSKEMKDNSTNIIYEGWRNKDEIILECSKGGFGLVWGNSENPEDERDYYKMNCSYKLSTYLCAGIPVVVPSYLSNADFIEKHGLGYVVHSLEEANKVVEECSEEKYNELVSNIRRVAPFIRDGYFTKKAIADAIVKLIG